MVYVKNFIASLITCIKYAYFDLQSKIFIVGFVYFDISNKLTILLTSNKCSLIYLIYTI